MNTHSFLSVGDKLFSCRDGPNEAWLAFEEFGFCISFDMMAFLCMNGLNLSIYACYEQVAFPVGRIDSENLVFKIGVPMAISC